MRGRSGRTGNQVARWPPSHPHSYAAGARLPTVSRGSCEALILPDISVRARHPNCFPTCERGNRRTPGSETCVDNIPDAERRRTSDDQEKAWQDEEDHRDGEQHG